MMPEKRASAWCYVPGLVIALWLLRLAPYGRNRNIRFHAFQSIYLNLAAVLVWLACFVLLFVIHLAGIFLGIPLEPLLLVVFLALSGYLIIATAQGKRVVLPIVGAKAQQRAGLGRS